MNEADFKKFVRDSWDGWLESYEPRRGSGIGMADIQIVSDNRLIPIELKIGHITDGKLNIKEIRPAQINWHRALNKAGVKSFVMTGVHEPKGWRSFIFDAKHLTSLSNTPSLWLVDDRLSEIELRRFPSIYPSLKLWIAAHGS